ncbi:MAG: hypothetical protein ACQ9MH_25980, partial [Nitrospinales bacterium]
MITSEELQTCINQLHEEIDAIDPNICRQFPITAYIHDVKSYTNIRMHSYYRPRRKNSISAIKKRYGSSGIALYQKIALGGLMQDALERLETKSFPEGIIQHIHSWYKRVIWDFGRLPDSYYDISKTDFNIDFGVCCLKNLPIGGAWFVQTRMMSPRIFLTFNIRRIKRVLRCIFFNAGGLSPYCIIHSVPRYMLRFNCQQMNQAYQQIGELMKCCPEIKGIFRKSWFLDPGLKNINPEMAYLREIPMDNGAVFFEAGTTRYDIRDA